MKRPVVHTILVVDDQPMVGKAVRRMLAGHDITLVASARAALDKVAAGERFDVILTDVTMPEMTGMELYEQIATLAPEQARRMLFMTGGAFTAQARAFFAQVDCPRIEKPFDRARLRAEIENLLR